MAEGFKDKLVRRDRLWRCLWTKFPSQHRRTLKQASKTGQEHRRSTLAKNNHKEVAEKGGWNEKPSDFALNSSGRQELAWAYHQILP